MGLLSWLGNEVGGAVHGVENMLHPQPPQPPQRPTAPPPNLGAINQATGFNNTPVRMPAPVQPYQAPVQPTLQQFNQRLGFTPAPIRTPLPVNPNNPINQIGRGIGNVVAGVAVPMAIGAGEVFNRDINAPVQATLQSGVQAVTGKPITWGKNYQQTADQGTSAVTKGSGLADKQLGTNLNGQVNSSYAHPMNTAVMTAIGAVAPELKAMGAAGKVVGTIMGTYFTGQMASQIPSAVKAISAAPPSQRVQLATELAGNVGLAGLGALGTAHEAIGAYNDIAPHLPAALDAVKSNPLVANQTGSVPIDPTQAGKPLSPNNLPQPRDQQGRYGATPPKNYSGGEYVVPPTKVSDPIAVSQRLIQLKNEIPIRNEAFAAASDQVRGNIPAMQHLQATEGTALNHMVAEQKYLEGVLKSHDLGKPLTSPRPLQLPATNLPPTRLQQLIDGLKNNEQGGGQIDPMAKSNEVAPIKRGFSQTLENSPNTAPALAKAVKATDNTYAAPRPTAEAYKAAQDFVKRDISSAKDHALNGMDDSSVFTAQALIDHYQKTGDITAANELASQAAINLTEHGRAVQAASVWNHLDPQGILQHTNNLIQKAGGTKIPDAAAQALVDRAKEVQAMPDGREKLIAQGKLQQDIAKQIPSKLKDQAIGVWKAGLLTGPKTVAKIAISHPLMGSLETIKDLPAAAIDKGLSLATGKRTVVAPDLTQGRAAVAGGVQGLKDAGTYLKTGVKLPNSSGIGMGQLDSHAHYGSTPIGKALDVYTQTPGRVHGAISMAPYEARYGASLAQQAEAEAINQGLKGADKQAFVKDAMANPTSKMADEASKQAQYATLQQKTALGQAAGQIQQKLGPLGQVIAPFTRIPGAVATDLINYSPVGVVKSIAENIGKGKFDQRALSQGIGRGVTGTGIMYLGAQLMKNGMMTGPYPTNKDQQAQWQLEGKQPNSVLVNGKWQSIGALGPTGQALLAGGQAMDGYQKGGLVQGAAQGGSGALKAVTDQPYLTGLSGALNAINTPNQATSFLDQSAGSIIPTGIKQVAIATDPLQRTTAVASPITSMKNAITNGIPGLREQNLPKQNVFGQDQAREGSTISNLINPLNPTTATTSPLISELGRVQQTTDVNGKNLPTIAQMPHKIPVVGPDGVKTVASDQLRQQFIASTGPAIQTELNKLIASPQYVAATDQGKSKMIGDVVSGQRGVGKLNVLGETPSKLSSQTKSAMNGLLPTGTKVSSKTDPAGAYQQALLAYNQKVKAGTITPSSIADFNAKNSLAKQAITSQFPADVVSYYNMSKAQKTAYAAANPTQASQLAAQAQSLSNALGGSTRTRSTRTRVAKAPRMPKMPKMVAMKTPKFKVPKLAHLKVPKLASAKTVKFPTIKKTKIA